VDADGSLEAIASLILLHAILVDRNVPRPPRGAGPEVWLGVDALELEQEFHDGRVDRRVEEHKIARLAEGHFVNCVCVCVSLLVFIL